MTQPAQLCRVQVWLEGFPMLNYRAERAAADKFAAAVRSSSGTVVTIDSHTDDSLRPLPCERLWR